MVFERLNWKMMQSAPSQTPRPETRPLTHTHTHTHSQTHTHTFIPFKKVVMGTADICVFNKKKRLKRMPCPWPTCVCVHVCVCVCTYSAHRHLHLHCCCTSFYSSLSNSCMRLMMTFLLVSCTSPANTSSSMRA